MDIPEGFTPIGIVESKEPLDDKDFENLGEKIMQCIGKSALRLDAVEDGDDQLFAEVGRAVFEWTVRAGIDIEWQDEKGNPLDD